MDYQSTPIPPRRASTRKRLVTSGSLEEAAFVNNRNMKIARTRELLEDDPRTSVFAHWWYTDYADSIHGTLRKREEQTRMVFCLKSPNLEHRDHCVNIVRSFAVSENLMRSTVHLAVYVLDTFMDNHTIAIDRLALVTLISLVLAAKMEEHETNITQPQYLNSRIDQPYPINDYKQLECMIFRFFGFQLNIPTAVTFIEYYIEAIADAQDFELANVNISGVLPPFNSLLDMKRNLADVAFEFVDLVLSDVRLVQAPPSKMAAACLAAARKCSKCCYIWSTRLTRLTRYRLTDIDGYMKRLLFMRDELVEGQSEDHFTSPADSGYLTSGEQIDVDEDSNASG